MDDHLDDQSGEPPIPERKRIWRCPECGGRPLARIEYGLIAPDEQLMAKLQAGRVMLGGCFISDDDPSRACLACDTVIWSDGRTMPMSSWRPGWD